MQNKFFLEYRRHKISTGYFLVFLFTCAYGISCIIQRDFSFVNIFFIILALAGFLISLRTDYICGLYIDGTNLKFYGKIFTFKINVNEIKYIKLSKERTGTLFYYEEIHKDKNGNTLYIAYFERQIKRNDTSLFIYII